MLGIKLANYFCKIKLKVIINIHFWYEWYTIHGVAVINQVDYAHPPEVSHPPPEYCVEINKYEGHEVWMSHASLLYSTRQKKMTPMFGEFFRTCVCSAAVLQVRSQKASLKEHLVRTLHGIHSNESGFCKCMSFLFAVPPTKHPIPLLIYVCMYGIKL